MSSSKWKKVILSDIGDVITGKTPSTKKEENFGSEYKFVTPRDMTNDKIIVFTERYLSKEGAKSVPKQVINCKSICVSCIGSDMGKVSIVDGSFVTNQQINTITNIDTKKFDIDFIYYTLLPMKEYFHNIAGGSTMPIVNKSTFSSIEIDVPEYNVQKSISEILSNLDKKIEINRQINEKLEDMAQSIFKQWFINFEFPNEEGEPYKSSGGEMVESELGMIPKGWEVRHLGEIANITMGQSPKGTSYNEDGEGEVFYQGRTDFTKRFPVRRLFTSEPKRMAKKGDILMSVRAPVGDLNIANEECCIGRGLSALNSKTYDNSFLLYTMLELKAKFDVYNGEGTVFGSINQKDLKSIKVIKPLPGFIEQFENLVAQMDKKYEVLEQETRTLAKLRDTLLPKLMSGELRVPIDE